MKYLLVAVGILLAVFLPAVTLAQYDYPSGGPPMGGGAAETGGGGAPAAPDISVGIDLPAGVDLPIPLGDDGAPGAVTIVDFAFQPAFVSVPVGSAVSWQNGGAAPHTVTADGGAFDSGTIAPGGSYSETLAAPGVYRYHCAIHPNMMGTIMVSGS